MLKPHNSSIMSMCTTKILILFYPYRIGEYLVDPIAMVTGVYLMILVLVDTPAVFLRCCLSSSNCGLNLHLDALCLQTLWSTSPRHLWLTLTIT